MMHVLPLDAHLSHWLRSHQRANLGHHRALQGRQHQRLSLAQRAVDKHHVHSGAQPLNHLHLQHRALHLVTELQLLRHARLGQLAQQLQQVRQAVPRDGRGGHHAEEAARIGVVVVHRGVQALLVDGENGLLQTLVVLAQHVRALGGHGALDGGLALGLPVVQPVHFVQGDDERRLAHAQQVQTLQRLLLQAVHDVNHQDGQVAQA
mmetsp:Transcript_2035/g.4148  ORF Transcript_2035/g.4148 Transcript_2035/m.4148 type:complete len:206 (+) Transcript_2035:1199-1816(+)